MDSQGKTQLADESDKSTKPRRILIVEDELLVGMEMARVKKVKGWDVLGPAGTVERRSHC